MKKTGMIKRKWVKPELSIVNSKKLEEVIRVNAVSLCKRGWSYR